MAVDERRRKALYEALERTLGSEEAATMMELVPRGHPDELATKGDIESLRLELRALIAERTDAQTKTAPRASPEAFPRKRWAQYGYGPPANEKRVRPP